VLIHPQDQVFYRFLWRKQGEIEPTVYQWKRLNFVDKPAPDFAISCVNTLANMADTHFPEAVKDLKEHSYADDSGGSKSSSEDANRVTTEISAILAKGKFEIKAWHSNHSDVYQTEDGATTFHGHNWDKAEDEISFKKEEIKLVNKTFSKRKCLACVAQIWDPVGLVTPVSIELTIDLQEL
ncbi:predicted protein, partial [Nematostella vectensis]